jgi:ubiquinone/menaquinone biosynthesis C-methylase UbiE
MRDEVERCGGMDEQRETVRREFGKQASNFEAEGSLFRHGGILGWIAAHIEVPPGARILDVAGGTGQVGRHLARDGATAVIADLTDAMLAAGLRSVQEEGRDDVIFVRGDATDLPFPNDQFEVVVSRFALHHMDDPGAAIAEMARVCRPDGAVTLIDMVAGGDRHDELERLRDPSHTRALPEGELRDLIAAAGREAKREADWEQALPVERWLQQAETPAEARSQIRAALEEEADGGAPTGLRAQRADEGLMISQRWLLIGG